MKFESKNIKVSKEGIQQAKELAKEAFENDQWMTAEPEPYNGYLGEIIEGHREHWQQTTHFHENYGNKLSEITDEEEIKLTGSIGGLSHIDLGRYEGIYIPLLDAFWDEWEKLTGLIEKSFKLGESQE